MSYRLDHKDILRHLPLLATPPKRKKGGWGGAGEERSGVWDHFLPGKEYAADMSHGVPCCVALIRYAADLLKMLTAFGKTKY